MKIVYDIKLRRPGCALLQAVGGTPGIAGKFPTESWLLSSTTDMKIYEVTEEQLQILIKRAEKGDYVLR